MSDAASLDAAMEAAVAHQRAGRLAEAERLYRKVLQQRPVDAIANHNLGAVLAQSSQPEQGLAFLKRALQAEPAQGQYWLSYARGLLACGRPDEALRLLETARQRGLSGPGLDGMAAQAQADLGAAHSANGRLAEAIAAYRRAVAIRPEFAEAHFHLAAALSQTGAIAEGFEHFMRRADLVYGPQAPPRPPSPLEPAHKLKHDREQRDYLAGGQAPPGAPAVADMFRIADGARLSGPAVNPANATPELLAHWSRDWPQLVVIDDFLTPPALEKLRLYCAGSTIWRRIYQAGYIGATPEDGFACPLLAQIAEEIQATYPAIFAPHRFRYLGAFKYDSELSTGTNTHADNSAVNVNFYITPDEANLDPAHGGMEIWDVCAPDEPTMRHYNGDEAAVRAFLAQSGAKSTIVPHRANRAVFFKSALFHKTDQCAFKEGYLNKRINVSLLFGDLDAPTR
ncbi:tetratricopeptide repeat protein [Phenylobacterium hankyongense]|nr:tetratricopeptide repeat protein [Phenylobacterium hankyongense]